MLIMRYVAAERIIESDQMQDLSAEHIQIHSQGPLQIHHSFILCQLNPLSSTGTTDQVIINFHTLPS